MDNNTKKRPHQNDTVSDNFSRKKPKHLNDDVFTELSLDEDQLSKLLHTPSSTDPYPYPYPYPVKFASYPYVSPPPVEHSTSYVTINGNEETCGSSFSDTHSSLMATLDTAFLNLAHSLSLWGAASSGACARQDDWDWTHLLFADDDVDNLFVSEENEFITTHTRL